jgi:hypothetical protein
MQLALCKLQKELQRKDHQAQLLGKCVTTQRYLNMSFGMALIGLQLVL